MQNRTDSGTLCFSTPQPNMDVSSLNDITIKVVKCKKYEIKAYNSSDFWFVPNILSFPSNI